jgi:anti-sigma regulatory factor (Ser/Thr protein kinase)
MEPHGSARTNGRPPPVESRPTSRHETVIHLLTQRCAMLREGAAALKAENTELRLEVRRLSRGRPQSAWPGWTAGAPASWEVELPAGRKAPGAARIALATWLDRRVPRRVLDDAQLLVSELVTNGVLHAGLEPPDVVCVRVELASGALRVHVEDPGTIGAIAPGTPNVGTGTGFGLNLVATLASQWGVSRNGGTRVWAELTWPN